MFFNYKIMEGELLKHGIKIESHVVRISGEHFYNNISFQMVCNPDYCYEVLRDALNSILGKCETEFDKKIDKILKDLEG